MTALILFAHTQRPTSLTTKKKLAHLESIEQVRILLLLLGILTSWELLILEHTEWVPSFTNLRLSLHVIIYRVSLKIVSKV